MADDKDNNFAVARYDAMCRAIAEAHRVDEVKDLRDKAAALQHYAKQAGNYEAERQCAEIRLRAERRAGELLAAMDKAKGGRPSKTGSTTEPVSTLEQIGVTKKQSAVWQRLAQVPEERFETLLNGETSRLPPSAYGIIDESARLDRQIEFDEKFEKLSPEAQKELEAKLHRAMGPGLTKAQIDCALRAWNMDPVTGAPLSWPKPDPEMLHEAEAALVDWLARFDDPHLARVRRLIREARDVIEQMMLGEDSGTRH
jgi:hypothetical protein